MTTVSHRGLQVLCVLLLSGAMIAGAAADERTPHLLVEILDARNLANRDTFGKSDPYITVQAIDKDGDAVKDCEEARWVTNDNTLNPAWFTTKMICRKYPADAGAAVRVKLMDDDPGFDDKLGRVDVTLADLGVDTIRVITVPTHDGKEGTYPQELRIRVRQYYPTATTKRVYFMRHGESKWDAKTIKMQLGGTPDHPLTEKGKDQAVAIAAKISSLIEGKVSTDAEHGLLRATVAMTSPLTRAIETAVIAVDPLVRNGSLSAPIVVKRNARAQCTRARPDNYGQWTGADVVKGAKGALHDLYGGKGLSDSLERSVDRLDVDEAQDKWWPSTDAGDVFFDLPMNPGPEYHDDFRRRIDAFFLEQLLWYSESDVILVGHSHFLRMFIRHHMQEGLEKAIDGEDKKANSKYSDEHYSAVNFQTRHMEHGGVMALTLDYSGYVAKMEDKNSKASIKILADLSMMFGSKLRSFISGDS